MFIAKKYSTFNEFIFFSEYSVLLKRIRAWPEKHTPLFRVFVHTHAYRIWARSSIGGVFSSSLGVLYTVSEPYFNYSDTK